MNRNKILFIIISILFVLILLFFVFDFSRKTTFPGSYHIREKVESGGLVLMYTNGWNGEKKRTS